MKQWFKEGEHWIWFSSAAVSVSMVLVVGLVAMISYKGLKHFAVHDVHHYELKLANGQKDEVVGEHHDEKLKLVENADGSVEAVPQYLIKVGNRDIYGIDFRWISSQEIQSKTVAANTLVIERFEWGHVFGQLQDIRLKGQVIATGDAAKDKLEELVSQAEDLHSRISHIEKVIIGGINYSIEQLRLEQKKLEANNEYGAKEQKRLADERDELNSEFEVQQAAVQKFYQEIANLGSVSVTIAGGKELVVPIKQIVRFWYPNELHGMDAVGFFFSSLGHFLFDDPREANTEGGVFPAIIGTMTMVMLMAILVTPMGVLAAVYMSEYAKDGTLLRAVRISINNLAGVPSIVFGIFGLGFFVYIIGGSIDELFYSYALPSPTFGTPGLLWAALTMALLTLPVVIVSTQEGLSRIPRALREGGLALGATKSETITRIVLPMATPAIMTGLILAIARAAGEVAPLMLVGVVKLAPALPIDMNEPFIHLDRKFMHLGFHIYDVGFQSPNVEASQPLVYATSLLLIIIIVALNLGAIMIRNRLRERYKALDN